MNKYLILFSLIYLLLMPVSYSGCVGYWINKYQSNNIWDTRGICAVMTLWPMGPLIMPFLTGFFNRGLRI